MRRFLFFLVIVLVTIVGAAIVAPQFIPAETYKGQVIALVKQQTGRDLTIDGGVQLTILPRLGVRAERVSLSNADWARSPKMIEMEELGVSVALLPLLQRTVEVSEFRLVRPNISLEVNKSGKANWEFEGLARGEQPPAVPTETTESDGGAATIDSVVLGDIRLVDGQLSYRDATSGAAYEVSGVNLTLAMPTLDDPLDIDGSLVWNGDTIELAFDAAQPRALLEGGETPAEIALSTRKAALSFEGTMTGGANAALAGATNVDIPSIRELAAWTGSPLPDGGGLGPLALSGTVSASQSQASFTDVTLKLDDIDATGGVSIVLGGAVPSLKGRLDVGTLNFTPYVASGDAGDGNAGGGSGSKGWSTDRIDLSGLKAVNAEFDLTAERIRLNEIKVGRSALDMRLKGGVLEATLSKLALYDGRGSGEFRLDGRGSAAKVASTFTLNSVSALPLLNDAGGIDLIEGTGDIRYAINAAGRSQAELVGTLGGKAAVTFRDGALRGFNIAEAIRDVGQLVKSEWRGGGTRKTDFSELSATFKISKGIATNNDLKMQGPLVRATGKGRINMPKRTIDYRLEPKLVAALEGQGGKTDRKGIVVPLIIQGPWDAVSVTPDLAALVSDPDATVDSIKGVVESAKEGGFEGMLEGVLGGGSGDGSEDAAAENEEKREKKDAKDVLKGLFGN